MIYYMNMMVLASNHTILYQKNSKVGLSSYFGHANDD